MFGGDGRLSLALPNQVSPRLGLIWDPTQIGKAKLFANYARFYENVPVVSVMDFGAFVQIMPGKDGLVHVSEMKEERVNKPGDVVKEGDLVTVKLVAIDGKGRLILSMKQAARELNGKK